MAMYGVQLGLAGATAALVAYWLGVDHPGWPVTAALLVSRPDRWVLDARSWQRIASVLVGALLACAVAALDPAPLILAGILLVVLVAATGTTGSGFYILPMFTTMVVLMVLIRGEAEPASHWFVERLGLTVLGVAIALVAAWVVPVVWGLLSCRRSSP